MPHGGRNVAANGYLRGILFIERCLSLLKPGGRLAIAGGADIGFYVGDQATRPAPSVRQLSRPCAYTQENVNVSRENGRQVGGG